MSTQTSSKRTKSEMIEYFEILAHEYSVKGHRENNPVYLGKAEAYELAAFELSKNME